MQSFLNANKNHNALDIAEIKSVSQIPWKPFPATSSALMAIDSVRTIKGGDEDGNVDIATDIPTTALSVLYASEYINGKCMGNEWRCRKSRHDEKRSSGRFLRKSLERFFRMTNRFRVIDTSIVSVPIPQKLSLRKFSKRAKISKRP